MTGVCDVRVLLVSGSTRSRSTNTAALRSARELQPPGCASLYAGLAALPAFDPDADHPPLPAAVDALRSEIAAADVIVFCTPEYAGTLPGSFKNLLDWTVGGAEISDKPTTWTNVAAPGTGADATLALVLGYGRARRRGAADRRWPPRLVRVSGVPRARRCAARPAFARRRDRPGGRRGSYPR